jgi:hypothetical protein
MKKTLVVWGAMLAASVGYAAPDTPSPSAPQLRCEISLSAWCIVEGVYRLERQLANDSVHDRMWSLQGRFNPRSRMLVLEPNGCRGLYSDALTLQAFDENVKLQGETWDRLRVRLDSNGRCDLDVFIAPDTGDPLEWAFSEGLGLIRTCRDESCKGPSLAQLKPAFESRFHRKR